MKINIDHRNKTQAQLQAEYSEALTAAKTELSQFKGKKVSMLIENSVGCVLLRHITLDERSRIENGAYYHSKFVTVLYYRMKDCRKVTRTKIDAGCLLAIADGWQTIEGMTESKKGQFGFDVRECFDNDRYNTALSKLNGAVVLR